MRARASGGRDIGRKLKTTKKPKKQAAAGLHAEDTHLKLALGSVAAF